MTHKEVCGDTTSNPCLYGGACSVDLDYLAIIPSGGDLGDNRNYECTCLPGYSGYRCGDLDPCGTDPCENELEEDGCINDVIKNDYTLA